LLGWMKCECPMRPMPVVMAGIDVKHVFELPEGFQNAGSVPTRR